MEKYILLYGDKKEEDNICINNMFENTKKINLGWTDFDYNNNMKLIEEIIKNECKQIVFLGLEVGWDKLVTTIKENYKDIKIKVICNTADSLLYYEYERENFFKLLELSKKKLIDDIAFLKKGQYKIYENLGYSCSYLMQNFVLEDTQKKTVKEKNKKIDIGMYPLNYTWDKNIFNQLCIAKFVENSNLNYNNLDQRMKEFLETMNIKSKEDNIEKINLENIQNKVIKNDINVSCSFTEYFHTVFFISMEQGIPCVIGNNSDLFGEDEEDKKLKNYVVTTAEDNAIINSELVKKCLDNKEEIIKLYKDWKQKYNEKANKNKIKFLEK